MENSPINAFQQLMAITAEECSELTQVAMKQIRKYDDVNQMDDNMHRQLIEEVGDVMCMFELMIEYGLITKDDIDARIQIKRDKLKVWSTLIPQ
jgi:NTP pyrophosphatase (non-canonical NTP hydrolase)